MKLPHISLFAFLLFAFGSVAAQTSADISVREYGRYRFAGDDWIILLVPPGTMADKLIDAARNLHTSTPELKYEFFDAEGKELDRYFAYQRAGGRGDYSDKWVSKHNIANLQVMSLDAGQCANWCLIKEGSVFARFERIKCVLDTRTSNADPFPIKTTYDRFTDKTTVSATTKVIGEGFYGLYLSISATFTGQKAGNRPEQLLLMISAVDSSIALAENRQLLGVVDNERIDFGELRLLRSDRVDTTAVSTAYGTMIPYLTALRLSLAGSVEMRFDQLEFKIPATYQSKLHDMLRQFPN